MSVNSPLFLTPEERAACATEIQTRQQREPFYYGQERFNRGERQGQCQHCKLWLFKGEGCAKRRFHRGKEPQ